MAVRMSALFVLGQGSVQLVWRRLVRHELLRSFIGWEEMKMSLILTFLRLYRIEGQLVDVIDVHAI